MARYFRSKRKGKYKSKLEADFAALCFKHGVGFKYESSKFPYVRPSHYNPDWEIAKDVFIETKGYLAPSNRANLIAFKEQYPHVKILLLFGNAQNKLNARSKTTYAEWAEKHGFEWADFRDGLPLHWWKRYSGGPAGLRGRPKNIRSGVPQARGDVGKNNKERD